MTKKTTLCTCGGSVEWEKRLVDIAGKNFGHHDVGICRECGSRFLMDDAMEGIEENFYF